MRLGLSAMVVLLGVSNAAWAKDVKLPEDKPALNATLPDAWSPKSAGHGYEATSPDGAMFVSLEAGDPKDIKDLIAKSIQGLADKGVELDTDSKKKTDGVINNMRAVNVEFTGKYKDADTAVSLVALFASEDKVVVVTFWGSEQAQRANVAAIGEIQASLKPIN